MGKINQKLAIQKIKNRFKIIDTEIGKLVENKYYFEKFKKYVDNSKTIDKEQDFLNFIGRNYRLLSLIDVCKQIDEDPNSESLLNLLKDIKNNSSLFTKKWFTASYPNWTQDNFKRFSSKNNKLVSVKKIDEDIKKIKKAIKGQRFGKKRKSVRSLCKYRNKRVAHFDQGKPEINVPLDDLKIAIDLLEEIILKYNSLLNGGCEESRLAGNVDDFLEFEKIFKV